MKSTLTSLELTNHQVSIGLKLMWGYDLSHLHGEPSARLWTPDGDKDAIVLRDTIQSMIKAGALQAVDGPPETFYELTQAGRDALRPYIRSNTQ